MTQPISYHYPISCFPLSYPPNSLADNENCMIGHRARRKSRLVLLAPDYKVYLHDDETVEEKNCSLCVI